MYNKGLLYNQLMGGRPQQMTPNNMSRQEKMMMAMQAMQNPAVFVKNMFPDIPDNIQNDPNQILGYL